LSQGFDHRRREVYLMCPRLFSVVIEIRVMLPDHLMFQFNDPVAQNHEGFRGTLWKRQEFKLPSDSLCLVRSEYTGAAGDPAR
jgi:hypothetical protein